MNNWKKTTLGEVCNFRRGHDLPKYDMQEGMVPVAGSNGIIGYHDKQTNIEPCITIGRSGNVGTPYYYEKCWAHNTVLYIDDYKGNDPKFIYYFIKTLNLGNYSGGSAVPTLNRNHIHPIEVYFPIDIDEQKRIADVLSALDDKIEINNKINENLEAQAQAIFKQWFVDFEFPDEEGKPYKSNGGKFIDSELGEIPIGWKVGSIYELVDVIYGSPYKSKLFNEDKKGFPLIRIRDLKTFSPFYYTEETLPTTEYINEGDIIAGMDAEFTPCVWKGKTGVLNQRVCKFKSHNDCISNLFVYFHIKPHLDFLQFHKVGTTVSHMGKSDIDRINIIIPKVDICDKYAILSNRILDKILNNSKENQNLSEIRDSLLPKLMSGEVGIKLKNIL